MKKYDEFLKTAKKAALASGKVLKENFQTSFSVQNKKGDMGLLTEVDLKAEKAALDVIKKATPDFEIIAEETSPNGMPSKNEAKGKWIIDPLDGTTNYVHGFPMFCVSIAVQWEDEICVGVIYHPLFDDLYVAIKDQGATLNGKKISVSKRDQLSESLLTTGFAYTQGLALAGQINLFEKVSKAARAVRRPGSAALDLAYTARGVFDGFWEENLSSWDVAAGGLLVKEAGGLVTNFKQEKFNPYSRQIIATNKHIHPFLIDLIRH